MKLSGYRKMISEATGVKNPRALENIEEIMRTLEGGVLDHLTAPEFKRVAKNAHYIWERENEA